MKLATIRLRDEGPYLAGLFFFLIAVYFFSTPRTLTLEDDGLFVLAAYYNGIAHPPGYPLYTLLAHVMTYLPLGSIAFRVHLLSGIFAAFACVCLTYLMCMLVPTRIYAYVAGLALGVSQVFWSQAIIAEVYTLNAFLFLWLLILAFFYADESDANSNRLIMLMGLLYGLSLCNHWPLLILSTPALIVIMSPKWRQLLRQIPIALPFLLLGLLPYAWMVFRSQMAPEFSFYGPLESWRDFWFVVSRKGYAGLDQSLSAGWWDKWQFSIFVVMESARQFGPLGFALAVLGFILQWKKWSYRVSIAFTVAYVFNTFVLIALLGFDYELLHRNIFRVYPIIAYSIMALWTGLGMFVSMSWLANCCRENVNQKLLVWGLSVLLIATLIIQNSETNYRAVDDWTKRYAQVVFDNIESDAIIFTDGDLDMNPLAYFHRIEGMRKDITLYNNKGVGLSNRLFYPLKDNLETRKVNIAAFIREQQRPVYYTYGLPHDYQVTKYSLYQKVNTDTEARLERSIAKPEIVSYFKKLLDAGEPTDAWEVMHYRLLVTDYCILSLNLLRDTSGNVPMDTALLDWIEIICRDYQGLLEQIDYYSKLEQADLKHLESLIKKADMKQEQAVLKSEIARLDDLKARYYAMLNDSEKVSLHYKRSIQKWPHPDNPANKLIEN